MNSVFGILWDIARTLILVGVIIFVHELGHFLAAKKLGITVERFSIGFGPKMIGFMRGGTEYRISWLPFFGGYVKMAGENPAERPDGETEETEEEKAGRFDKAPVSHRIIVAVAGPGMNILLAVFAVTLAYMVGMPDHLVPHQDTTIGYVYSDSPASSAGIIPGDKIISVGGYRTRVWDDIKESVAIHPDEDLEITLLRNQEEINLHVVPEHLEYLVMSIDQGFESELDNGTISEELSQEFEKNKVSLSPDVTVMIKKPDSEWLITNGNKKYSVKKEKSQLNIYRETEFGKIGIAAVTEPTIGDVEQGSVAADAGFRQGDLIMAVDQTKIRHIIEFIDEMQNASGESITLTVKRGESIIDIPLALEFDDTAQLVSLSGLSFGGTVRMNPISAFGMGVTETIRMGGKIFQFLRRLIVRDVPMKYVAGPIGIVQLTMIVVKSGLGSTLNFAGFLSVNLGIVNLLPLFITDGGMIVFLIIEKLRRKPMSYKKQLIIQQVGIGFIILLFLFITYNDVLRLVKGAF